MLRGGLLVWVWVSVMTFSTLSPAEVEKWLFGFSKVNVIWGLLKHIKVWWEEVRFTSSDSSVKRTSEFLRTFYGLAKCRGSIVKGSETDQLS